ncbi:MAG: hypothetical protein Q9227_003365 [Pyrenula ochraceoflavens]
MVALTHLILALSAVVGSFAAPTAFDEPDFIISADNHTDLVRRQDYTQNYQTGGNVQFSSSTNGYSVTFSSAADFVVGRGWTTGSARTINYSGTFSATSGTALLAIYGWTTNPLVEYYVQEDYTSYSGGTLMGTLTSDGGTYNIYETTRTNAPSIQGTQTFHQYISVRQSKRTSGTVTMANHFNAWASHGMNLGTQNYQVLATEGFNSATGSCKQTISG